MVCPRNEVISARSHNDHDDHDSDSNDHKDPTTLTSATTNALCVSLSQPRLDRPLTMAFNQVSSTSLTPSRPAPPAPQRAGPGATYNPAFSIPSSSGNSYSGIGGSPNRNSENIMNTHIVRSGVVSIKEDGFATSWLWRPKWLVLKEQTLSIHKNEVSLTYRLGLLPHITIRLTMARPNFILSRPAQHLEPSIFEILQT